MAYDKGEFMQAIDMYKPLAEQGNAAAQNNLGVMYDQGEGVIQNYQEALKWFRLSAIQGDVEAQNNLGVMYDQGRGITKDY
ncbi:MAG: sel1 repeat family protein, partial [Nitrosospira sp.]|nr:sel1 repeat family protein [Nitrosospira sp.]